MFSIALAFVEISLLCKSARTDTQPGLGLLLSFYHPCLMLIYIVGVNRSSLKDMPIAKLTFLCPAFRPVCLCGAIEVLYRIAAYPYTLVMGDAVSLAVFPTVISLVTMTKAIH